MHQQRLGGPSEVKDATEEVQKICDKVRSESEEKAGKNFEIFEAKKFSSQVVAGTNYFIKVYVGGEDYVHLCVHEPLPHTKAPLKLLRQQLDKRHHDPVEFF